jgi:hypothetical protein
MSKASKSPKRVAQVAYHIAKDTLPSYNHRFSPKKFTQPQIFVCLILKIFFKTDYRGIVAILDDNPDRCVAGNFGSIKFELQFTVKIDSQSILASFTHWVLQIRTVKTGLNSIHKLYTTKSISNALL